MLSTNLAVRCQWDGLTKGSRCSACGYVLKRDYAKAPVRACKVAVGSDSRLRLGSAIKAGLDKIGVTQDRVAALVEEIGLPPSCFGCAKRQEQLDEFDRKAEAWLKRAAKWWRGEAT